MRERGLGRVERRLYRHSAVALLIISIKGTICVFALPLQLFSQIFPNVTRHNPETAPDPDRRLFFVARVGNFQKGANEAMTHPGPGSGSSSMAITCASAGARASAWPMERRTREEVSILAWSIRTVTARCGLIRTSSYGYRSRSRFCRLPKAL